MTVYITDANIFIDLHYSGLLGLVPRLGLSLVTTQLVVDELNPSQQTDLQALVSENVVEICEITIEEISDLRLPAGLSLPDRSAIYLAVRENGVLLSGDGLVRRTAVNFGLDVRGLLWLFDEFVSSSVIAPLEAAQKLRFLVDERGSRQPPSEVNHRLEKWLKTM